MCRVSLAVPLTLLSLCLACDSGSSEGGETAGGALDVASSDSAGNPADTGGGDSAATCVEEGPVGSAPSVACDEEGRKAWNEQLVAWDGWVDPGDGDVSSEPPPYSCGACEPLVDDHCTTACDCKAVAGVIHAFPSNLPGCTADFLPANREVPWRYWPGMEPDGAGCIETYGLVSGCQGFSGLYTGVDCVAGRCVLLPK